MKTLKISSFLMLLSFATISAQTDRNTSIQLFDSVVRLITSKGKPQSGEKFEVASVKHNSLTLELKVFQEGGSMFGAKLPSSYTYYPLKFKLLKYVKQDEDNVVEIGFKKDIKEKTVDSDGIVTKAKDSAVSYAGPKDYLEVKFENASDANELIGLIEKLKKLI